jgi:hypothetical protein
LFLWLGCLRVVDQEKEKRNVSEPEPDPATQRSIAFYILVNARSLQQSNVVTPPITDPVILSRGRESEPSPESGREPLPDPRPPRRSPRIPSLQRPFRTLRHGKCAPATCFSTIFPRPSGIILSAWTWRMRSLRCVANSTHATQLLKGSLLCAMLSRLALGREVPFTYSKTLRRHRPPSDSFSAFSQICALRFLSFLAINIKMALIIPTH